MTIIYFILILGVIILVHEFGHFIFSKLFGVYVYEFSIGMGPRLFCKKKKETEYSIRGIPLGGYVRLAGEETDDDEKVPKKRKLYTKKIWQRFIIMAAGATFNFIFAFIVLLVSAFIYGSVSTKPVVSSVSAGYPAYNSGIVEGDTIISINGSKVKSWSEAQIVIQSSDGNELEMYLKDINGNYKTIYITPKKVETDDGSISYAVGIVKENTLEKGFIPSIKYSIETTGSLFRLMFVTLKSLFTGGVAVKDLSGPVGIYSVVDTQSKQGFNSVLYLIAFLSINVGVINLIPFPAFDGGRILFLVIEKIVGKPVPSKIENLIHNIGFFILIALMIYVTFNDILRLF